MVFYNAFVPDIIYKEEYSKWTPILHMHRQKIILSNCISVCTIIAYLLCQCCYVTSSILCSLYGNMLGDKGLQRVLKFARCCQLNAL